MQDEKEEGEKCTTATATAAAPTDNPVQEKRGIFIFPGKWTSSQSNPDFRLCAPHNTYYTATRPYGATCVFFQIFCTVHTSRQYSYTKDKRGARDREKT